MAKLPPGLLGSASGQSPGGRLQRCCCPHFRTREETGRPDEVDLHRLRDRGCPIDSHRGGTRTQARQRNGGGGGEKTEEVEDVRFGLKEGVRITLFKQLVKAVDERGISKSCKEEWYRLADAYKLDRKNIKDLLEEGFSFKNKKWELPEATSTANNLAVRMDWISQRHNGSDPILAL